VIFTATVTANVGTPTGTVNFLDGTTLLGSVAVTSGSASFSSSSLALGSHSITAAYSGDANFIALTSSALTQTVFTIDVGTPSSGTSGNGSGSGATQTVTPGGTASYSLPISPSTGNSFPVDLKLTVSGLPAGATASITPSAWVVTSSNTWKLAANTALIGNTQLTIELPKTTASAQHQRGTGDKRISSLAPLALGLLMLPFVGRMRRASKRLRSLSVLLLLMAGMLTTLGVTGCTSGGGFFTQAQQSYLVTVTVSSGALQIPINLTLTVE
jgi:hypothetical protein